MWVSKGGIFRRIPRAVLKETSRKRWRKEGEGERRAEKTCKGETASQAVEPPSYEIIRRWIVCVAVQLIKIIYECSQVVAARWLMFIAYDARIGSIIYFQPATASRRSHDLLLHAC